MAGHSRRATMAVMRMKRRSDAYWQKRFELLEEARNREAGRYVAKFAKEARIAEEAIEKDITHWFQRMADNNGISLAEARKLLNEDELAEFHWAVDEFVRLGRANGLQFNPQLDKLLENASAKVHIRRLEAQQLRLRMHVQKLYGQHQTSMDELLYDAYQETFWHSAYEIQRGTGIGWQLEPLNPAKVDVILRQPWAADGRTFSDRIWTNQAQLVSTLETKLVQAVVRGKGAGTFIADLAKEMGVARHRAATLAYTEAAYFSSDAHGECYKRLGVNEYRIVATLDLRTSEICREMDGKVFPEKERRPGVTAYPFHPRCRTIDVPHFDDVWGERAARGMDGKTYYVPADMTYGDWLKAQKAEHGGERVDALQKAIQNMGQDKKQFDQYRKALGKDTPRSLATFQELKYNNSEGYRDLKTQYRKTNRSK